MTFVPGVGPRNATVAIVGEAPAKHEVKEGRPFAGPSGKILWPFFGMATGLHRSQVYVTNLWKEMFDERQEKEGLTEEEMAMAAAVLEPELKEMGSLKFIVAMGKHAARHFIADDVRMEQVHGIPVWSEKYNAWILPAFHPAAAMRDGARLAYTVDDLEAFGQLLNGQLRPRPVRPTGQYRRANKTMLRYGLEPRYGPEPGITEIAIDTEFDGGDPLMLTFSAREGQGWLILAEETELLELFRQVLEKWRPVVYGHNWLADLPILKKMGIDLIGMGLKLRDTMAYAWYRQTEPQGLKPLAWRHLGVDVTEFDELVAPYFNESLLAYLYAALAITEPELMERWGKPNKKTGVRKRLKDGRAKASQIHKLVKRFVGDYRKGKVKDVFKRWSKWEEDRISQLEEVVGEPPTFSLRGVPLEIAMKYAGADPDYTLGIAHALPPYSETVAEMDHSRLPMVAEMSERGIWVDLSRRDQLLAELEKDRELKLETLRILTEREDFNPNSPDHIAEVLFGIKKVAPGIREFLQDKEYLIPTGWNKKSGAPKTDKKALGTLRGQGEYDLPAHFLEYKELEKLLNTYVRPMHKYVDSSSILHPNWRHTRVPSGRLAAVRPNIMAIPAKTDRGLRVRWMFRARPGFKLVSFDHSQIELRLAAHVTNDPIMLQAFFDKIDLHTLTAARISKRDINDKEFWGSHAGKLLRALFKQINFGILYGATPERIYLELLAMGIRTFTLEEVQRLHQQWFELYQGVRRHLELVERTLQQQGYIEDMWGRRRKLPGAKLYGDFWPMSALREESIRQGFNHEIQGGAQGLLTNAMLRFYYDVMPLVRASGYEVYPLLQIHDELIFEISENEEAIGMFKELGLIAMTADQDRFEVPIGSGVTVGHDWSELKD